MSVSEQKICTIQMEILRVQKVSLTQLYGFYPFLAIALQKLSWQWETHLGNIAG